MEMNLYFEIMIFNIKNIKNKILTFLFVYFIN